MTSNTTHHTGHHQNSMHPRFVPLNSNSSIHFHLQMTNSEPPSNSSDTTSHHLASPNSSGATSNHSPPFMTLLLTDTKNLYKSIHNFDKINQHMKQKCPQLHITPAQLFQKLLEHSSTASWDQDRLIFSVPVKIRISQEVSISFAYDFDTVNCPQEEMHTLFWLPLMRMQGVMWHALKDLSEQFKMQHQIIQQYSNSSSTQFKEDPSDASEILCRSTNNPLAEHYNAEDGCLVRYLERIRDSTPQIHSNNEHAPKLPPESLFKWIPEIGHDVDMEDVPATEGSESTSGTNETENTAMPAMGSTTSTPKAKESSNGKAKEPSPHYTISNLEKKRKRELDHFIKKKRSNINKNSKKALKKKLL